MCEWKLVRMVIVLADDFCIKLYEGGNVLSAAGQIGLTGIPGLLWDTTCILGWI